MNEIRFEWDPAKAAANLKKHGVDFVEARPVFADERAKIISDPDHSAGEDRFILLGLSLNLRLLVVCHCYREANNTIRIISARKATKPGKRVSTDRCTMRKQYDFSKAKKNPYASRLKKQITIRLDGEAIDYFKSISEDVGIPYQSLINLYLRDCAAEHRRLNLSWQ